MNVFLYIVPKMSQLIKVVVPRVTTVGKRLPTVWRLNQTLTKKQHPDEPEDSRIEVFDHWLSSNDGIQPKNLECTSLRPSKNIHSLQHQVRKLKKNWKNCKSYSIILQYRCLFCRSLQAEH